MCPSIEYSFANQLGRRWIESHFEWVWRVGAPIEIDEGTTERVLGEEDERIAFLVDKRGRRKKGEELKPQNWWDYEKDGDWLRVTDVSVVTSNQSRRPLTRWPICLLFWDEFSADDGPSWLNPGGNENRLGCLSFFPFLSSPSSSRLHCIFKRRNLFSVRPVEIENLR